MPTKPIPAHKWEALVNKEVVDTVNDYMDCLEKNNLLPLSQEQIELLVCHVHGAICGGLGAACSALKGGDDLSGIDRAFAPRHDWKWTRYHDCGGQIVKHVHVCQRCNMWTDNVKQYKDDPCPLTVQ